MASVRLFTPEAILSYPNLFVARPGQDGGEPKFSCTLVFDEKAQKTKEFAAMKAPLRADFFGDTLVGPTLLQWGTDEQKREFLPNIMNGTTRWCQGFSEPNSGSDLASVGTRAVRTDTGWRLHAGPLMRRYLDGYLPMQAKLSFGWPKGLLALARERLADPAIAPRPADIAWARDVFRDLLKIRASTPLLRLACTAQRATAP